MRPVFMSPLTCSRVGMSKRSAFSCRCLAELRAYLQVACAEYGAKCSAAVCSVRGMSAEQQQEGSGRARADRLRGGHRCCAEEMSRERRRAG